MLLPISHWALEVTPAAALSNIDSEAGLLAALSRRLKLFWPELVKIVVVDAPIEPPSTAPRGKPRKPRRTEVQLETLEDRSDYTRPSDETISGEEPDER